MLEPGFYNMDCMEGMAQFPDKYFDLAVVDPPYGGGAKDDEPKLLHGGGNTTWEQSKNGRFGGRFRQYHFGDDEPTMTIRAERTGRGWAKKYNPGEIFDSTCIRHWDVAPGEEYFKELARVSKHQIIWGGNYFQLPPTRCFLVWRKLTIGEGFSMAMCEYAWTSFNDNAKLFECAPQGSAKEKRFHPTQKPVKLYSWIFNRYAKPGYKILDTHVGSASSLIAAHRQGLIFTGFEIDKEYYARAKERLDAEMAQVSLFDLETE